MASNRIVQDAAGYTGAVVQSHVKGREERKTSSETKEKKKGTKNRRLVVIHVIAVGVDRFVAQTACADMKTTG